MNTSGLINQYMFFSNVIYDFAPFSIDVSARFLILV